MSVSVPQQKRNQQILADVVRTYIETGEPVASRAVAKHSAEALSPATVRNIMADLEEEGYLYQPHTSAGRVPTAAAYRFYVEHVAAQATASPEDDAWIRRELGAATSPEAVLERASHVLAAVSKGLGIIIAPPLSQTSVEHLKFLMLPDGRVLVVLITGGGLTRDKVIRPERNFTQPELDGIGGFLNRHYAGWTLEAVRRDLRAQLERDRERYDKMARDALLLCDSQALDEDSSQRVYVEGAAQFATAPEFADQEKLRELLAAIEEKGKLVALLSHCIDAPEPVHVELGVEKISGAGKNLALVAAPYARDDQSQGAMGALGPMRMQYERVITVVALMSELISETLKRESRS